MKICDLTQFYSPRSGGVKRYVQEKIAFVRQARPGDEHLLIIPGAKTECLAAPGSRIYTIRSPLVSRSTQYRALLDLRAVQEIIEREKPDIIESADPYQVGWAAIEAGRLHRIPVVAYYHSHFSEAYFRAPAARLGRRAAEWAMKAAQPYTRRLYNNFAVTFVPSVQLMETLSAWGVRRLRLAPLGVDTQTFQAQTSRGATRQALGIPEDRVLLLYVGRLAPEKNTHVLFDAFALITRRQPGKFHLLVIGDGQERADLEKLQATAARVSWLSYCDDSKQLAHYYSAADLFVHPGVEETFGLVALESQACGTPVVGIRGSPMDRIIFAGLDNWAMENSPEALARAIELMSVLDLKTLGRRAADEAARSYGWRQRLGEIYRVYEETIGKFRRGSDFSWQLRGTLYNSRPSHL